MTNEELVEKIQQGERGLLPELWEQVRGFIAKVAAKWAKAAVGDNYDAVGDFMDDLIQTGYIALVEAAEAYRPDQEATFIHFLSFYLKKHFGLELAAHAGLSRAAQAAADLARQKLQSGQALSFDGNSSIALLTVSSLNAPYGKSDEEGAEVGMFIPSPDDPIGGIEESIYQQQLHDKLEEIMDTLEPDERQAVKLRYYQDMAYKEIAQELGVSRYRAGELEQSAMRKLRRPSVSKELEGYIEQRTPYYLHVGVALFQSSGTSAVERIVMLREQMRAGRGET